MSKRLWSFILLATFAFNGYAQISDSSKVTSLLKRVSTIEMGSENNDSVEILTREALAIAERIGFDSGRQLSYTILSDFYYIKGKLNLALNYLLKNEEIKIASGDSMGLFNILRSEAAVYNRIGDINMFRQTVMRRQFILDNKGIRNLKDTSYPVISQYNSLAQYYSNKKVNMPDSGAWYYRKMLAVGHVTAQANLWGQLGHGGIGNNLLEKGLHDSAIWYLKTAMALALEGKRSDNYYGYVSSLAKAYLGNSQLDSAFKYAYELQHNALRLGYNALLISSSGTLAKLFTQQKKYDSAVKYMNLESAYKDSVMGADALNNIQFLSSDFQMRKLERQREKEQAVEEYKARLKNYAYAGGILLLLIIIAGMFRLNKQRARSKYAIEQAYNDLKTTQAQLIQSEKMASLGELTAGIAHEIQNPLNFVNNFSEVNNELIEELKSEYSTLNKDALDELLEDIFSNNEKIRHHGKRAEAIVKGMLQHSRKSEGQKEATDINALCDEYIRLSYHGLRAKDKSFNATLKTDFDESLSADKAGIGKINIVPQDIGRVIMNILTNAFYAVHSKSRAGLKTQAGETYEPTVSVITKKSNNKVQLVISDNGSGIPAGIVDKIFQPFFTTKPTGQGTGLGLSLSYDIIKAHGGEIKVSAVEGESTSFTISLPNTYS